MSETPGLSRRFFQELIRKRLDNLEKRAEETRGCIASQREINILEEDIEEAYSKDSYQIRRFNKLKKRVCE